MKFSKLLLQNNPKPFPFYGEILRSSVRIPSRHPQLQCDQIWRNFATLAKTLKSWAIFEGLFTIWENFGQTLANLVCHWASFH